MLKDLLVIELASVLAGPSVGMFLAELGARVLKIENLQAGGDVTRGWQLEGEKVARGRVSAYFSSVNWGKESVAINLKTKRGQALVHSLIRQADVVVSNFRPGSAEAIGMDSETLMGLKPDLVLGEINGYGKDRSRPAYDAVIQAEAGFTYLNGEGNDIYKMPVALMDLLAGHQLKEAILLGLIKRMRSGEGSHISVSLIQAGLASLVNQASNWLVTGQMPRATGSDHPNITPYGTLYETRDGLQLVLAVGSDDQFSELMEVLGLGLQACFSTGAKRVEHRAALHQLLKPAILTWERDALLQALAQRGIPAGAVNTVREALHQEAALELLVQEAPGPVNPAGIDQPGMRGLRSFVAHFSTPAEASSDEPGRLLPPPRLNQHCKEILGGVLKLESGEIEELVGAGVVGNVA